MFTVLAYRWKMPSSIHLLECEFPTKNILQLWIPRREPTSNKSIFKNLLMDSNPPSS